MNAPVSLALVHYPTVNKHGAVVATSITNLDIHDLSRAARTYGVERVYLVHPYEGQQQFLATVLGHWRDGWGADYNPTRRDALDVAEGALDLGDVASRIAGRHGARPAFVATSARPHPNAVTFDGLRARIAGTAEPVCLVFGTGWGLHPEVMAEMDLILEPIRGRTGWNHLSVRSAVSIILDRLFGDR